MMIKVSREQECILLTRKVLRSQRVLEALQQTP